MLNLQLCVFVLFVWLSELFFVTLRYKLLKSVIFDIGIILKSVIFGAKIILKSVNSYA